MTDLIQKQKARELTFTAVRTEVCCAGQGRNRSRGIGACGGRCALI